MKKRLTYILIPVMLIGGMIAGLIIGRGMAGHNSSQIEKLRTILDLVDSEYVDQLDMDSLIEMTLPDLLATLDPHSVYIPKSELTAVNDELDASFSGVGVSFQILNDSVTVIEVVAGGPAEKMGLLAGDRIVEANGKKLVGDKITSEDVFSTLRGKKGSKVKVKVARRGVAGLTEYDIIRDEIPQNSVDASYMIDEGIGYVKVGKFAVNTYSEFLNAISDLETAGAKKYIVDLRGNTGGFMDQAILMANEFLPAGKKIVYTKGRNEVNNTDAISDGSGRFQNAEMVVLTNEGSASASEIFAGAIQDNDRGLVIGRRTFGKGLVQQQMMLPDSSAIRLTIARYYTPSGRSIQKEYKRGEGSKYELDILNRYNHGEFYNLDSVKVDKSKKYFTSTGRTVYGGGGILPDVFVPEDTTEYTSYFINVSNKGLIQKFSFDFTDSYRSVLKNANNIDRLMKVVPDDYTLIQNFAEFAENQGEPARWYYINKSEQLLLNQIKAVIARDVLGYSEFHRILNQRDKTIDEALRQLKQGKSPTLIRK